MSEKKSYTEHKNTKENKSFKLALEKAMKDDNFIDTKEAQELTLKYKEIKNARIK